MNTLTLDEWVEDNAADLRKDIICHIENATPENLDRMIMISIRQWAAKKGSVK